MDEHNETTQAETPANKRRGAPKGGWPRKVQETAIPVSESLSADADISEHAHSTDNRASLLEDIARIRQIRQPFGAFTQKLALPVRSGYHRHWFNDVAGRIDEAEAGGWKHIKGKDGKPIRRVVGTGRDNGALYAFAMELPEVFWEEDMQARNEAAASKMDELKKSPFRAPAGTAKASDKGKFYSPTEGTDPIQVTHLK